MAGGETSFMSYMDECNTASHTRSRGLRDDLPGGKGGGVVLVPLSLQLPSSVFYQLYLSGATAYKVKNFEGIPLSYYTLEICGNIFLVLEVEAQHTPMLSSEGIKIAKGEGVKD